jgi:acid phosphatase
VIRRALSAPAVAGAFRAWLVRFVVALPALSFSSAPSAADSPARPPAASVPRLDHIIVILMENKAYEQVRHQPYTAYLIASGASFSNSYAIAHPSQPNYLALWSGSTQGVESNRCPAPGSPFHGANLGGSCQAAGLTWRAYAEGLPATSSSICATSHGTYTRKHCPWTNWSNIDHRNERPYAALEEDIVSGKLPNLAFVIPNNCHNTHRGRGGCGPAEGDAWLAANLPAMVRAVGPRGVVVLTWDEDDGHHSNHILTLFKGRLVRRGYLASRRVTHYTVLRTLCDALGLPPFGAAAQETPITDVWAPDTAASAGDRARFSDR